MDRTLATEFARKHREFGDWFNTMTELSLRIADEAQARQIRRSLADMLFLLDDAVYLPLKRQHPDIFETED